MAIKEVWFLEKMEYYDGEPDISISNYKLHRVRKLKGMSSLRWVTLINPKIAPGSASGQIILNGKTYEMVYAWGGRHKDNKNWNDRTSYLVRLKGLSKEEFKKLQDTIIIDEHGTLTYEVPFREHHKDGIEGHQKFLDTLNVTAKKLKLKMKSFTKKQLEKMHHDFVKKWNAPAATVTRHHRMRDIEADMI